MKTEKELEEAIKDTMTMYKDIIFGSDTPVCMACLDELWKFIQVIDQKVYDQSSLPSFLPCSSMSSRCSFVISFTLALA